MKPRSIAATAIVAAIVATGASAEYSRAQIAELLKVRMTMFHFDKNCYAGDDAKIENFGEVLSILWQEQGHSVLESVQIQWPSAEAGLAATESERARISYCAAAYTGMYMLISEEDLETFFPGKIDWKAAPAEDQ